MINRKNFVQLLVVLFSFFCTELKAQDVYNYVLESSSRIVDDPMSSFTYTRIAQFKKTSLIYLKNKADETMPEVTDKFLNEQAYYLSEFVALFMQDIVNKADSKKSMRKRSIAMFINASLSNPLFNDSDTQTTECYVMDSESITPFSLNTNWEKAYYSVLAEQKKMKSKRK